MKRTFKQAISFLTLSLLLVAPQALGQGWNPSTYSDTGLPNAGIGAIIYNLLMWGLGIFGFIAVIGFVISGIMYLTAAGDTGQQETAKNAMKMSIIGIIVGLMGLVIIKTVDSLLNAGGGGGGSTLLIF